MYEVCNKARVSPSFSKKKIRGEYPFDPFYEALFTRNVCGRRNVVNKSSENVVEYFGDLCD